jgi:hypothetical protein
MCRAVRPAKRAARGNRNDDPVSYVADGWTKNPGGHATVGVPFFIGRPFVADYSIGVNAGDAQHGSSAAQHASFSAQHAGAAAVTATSLAELSQQDARIEQQ